MDPAQRYASIFEARLRETPPLLAVRRHLDELELQAHWFAGDFGRDFTTTAGEAVRVVQFGVWNREAGPDFTDAAISLRGGEALRGAIELDPDARDWERHGHATNPDYENVVLHVFTQSPDSEIFTRTAQHRNVPQVLLDISRLDDPPNPQPDAKLGHCAGPLRDLAEEKVREVLLGAALHRLRRKSAALARFSDIHGPDEALYQGLAATLGYKSNKLPFTLLAQRLPLRLMRAAKGDVDALLFGVAGFLDAPDLTAFAPDTRSYLRGLWEKWWPKRAEHERLTIARQLWNLGGQRPANHPQRRVAALAQIVRHWPKIRALRDACEPDAIHEFFAGLSDEYWDFHYTVTSKTSPKRMAIVGESRVTEMLVNVFFPLALAADPQRAVGFKNLPSTLTNRRVEIAALRLFGDAPLAATLLKNAAMQQGLLQIYEDFCMRDASDCAACLFPNQLAKW
ncbi:MAG: DUF2851 family protein [Chthoniobacteraceae bacterium]